MDISEKRIFWAILLIAYSISPPRDRPYKFRPVRPAGRNRSAFSRSFFSITTPPRRTEGAGRGGGVGNFAKLSIIKHQHGNYTVGDWTRCRPPPLISGRVGVTQWRSPPFANSDHPSNQWNFLANKWMIDPRFINCDHTHYIVCYFFWVYIRTKFICLCLKLACC